MDGKKKVTRVFEMTADTAMEFFEIVKTLTDNGIEDSIEMRNWVLNYLADKGKMTRVFDTKRTKDQIVSDFKAHGFNVDDRTEKKDD